MIQDEILKKIKEEITNDPQGLGYTGKTDDEILQILNNPVRTQRIVEDIGQSPMNRILSGIAGTPNITTLTEVQSAKILPAPVDAGEAIPE